MQLVATSARHPFQFIDALGAGAPIDTIYIPHRDNPPLDILFDNGLGDGRAGEIDAYPKVLQSFKWGGFVTGFSPRGNYVVSNYDVDEDAFIVTKTGGSRFTDFATTEDEKTATSLTAGRTS